MPLKDTNVMDQKKEFILEALKGEISFTTLCASTALAQRLDTNGNAHS